MMLSEEEYQAVLRTRFPLLLYAARRLDRHEDLATVRDLWDLTVDEMYSLSVTMCSREDLIDEYVQENPDGMTAEDLAMVERYRHARVGRFIMLKHLKRYTVLLGPEDPPVAYGIVGLGEELSDVFPHVPILIRTVLLPCGDRISFDGTVLEAGIIFGSGVRRGFEDEYREAKARYGVVTSLPFTAEERPDADVERMKAWTRSWTSVRENWEEIREMLVKDHALRVLYHQRLGKLAAKGHRKQMRGEGIEGGWFATIDGTLVAGARTRAEVERTVEALVPKHKRESVYIYEVKKR